MAQTLKVYTTGRFGARYGVSIKKRVLKVEKKQKEKHECPFCGFKKIKRKSRGIFECRKCFSEFAGGAFLPSTLAGNIVKKMVAQKSFASLSTELESAKEQEQQSLQKSGTEKHGPGKRPDAEEDQDV